METTSSSSAAVKTQTAMTSSSPTRVGDMIELVDDETAYKILTAFYCGVVPALACVGITWNVFSIIVLTKHGLTKCSNILLVSLAFSDATFLLTVTNVPNILYELQGDGSFLYSETVSRFLYYAFLILLSLDYTFSLNSLTLPMLITVERLVAVFMPLKFSRIITPTRTWMAVGAVLSYWVMFVTYTCFWYEFDYVFDAKLNRSVGKIGRSELFYKNQPVIAVLEEIHFSIKVPPLFTLLGCIIIIVKLKFISMKRKKMAASTKTTSTTRTTKTLLCVCLFYVITCVVVALPTYLPSEYSTYNLTRDKPSNLGRIMYALVNISVCINGTWNFLVYVGFNRSFRDTFKQLTVQKCCTSSVK